MISFLASASLLLSQVTNSMGTFFKCTSGGGRAAFLAALAAAWAALRAARWVATSPDAAAPWLELAAAAAD